MNDPFGDRMKTYESRNRFFMQNRTPVIVRIDGRSFHEFTKGLERPFDEKLNMAMAETAEYLLNNTDGCVFAYTQSDEISLLLVDYQSIDSHSWFDNNQQKIVSITASMATAFFNSVFRHPKKEQLATFDSRAFNIPKEEVVNYFIWRQQDCTKNSINMLARAYFTQKELQGKKGTEKQDMLMLQKNVNWNDIPTRFKRGIAVYKMETVVKHISQSEIDRMIEKKNIMRKSSNDGPEDMAIVRNRSYIDLEMPVLTQDRDFIKGF
ncbi:MAG: tRNA(His) guanylyltransferase Thg1 family protein [Methanomassiliicoccaceae archaeon]|nr:tRNA(His) guanylyltransferase Thg1 family protein [Methanomassiliicoccaceae archaeon]